MVNYRKHLYLNRRWHLQFKTLRYTTEIKQIMLPNLNKHYLVSLAVLHLIDSLINTIAYIHAIVMENANGSWYMTILTIIIYILAPCTQYCRFSNSGAPNKHIIVWRRLPHRWTTNNSCIGFKKNVSSFKNYHALHKVLTLDDWSAVLYRSIS